MSKLNAGHVAGLCAVVLLSVAGADAGEAMRLQITPSVARAPADLVVRVSVQHDADNRFLQVVAESADFYRSSEIPVDGESTPALSVFEFRSLPSGLYQVTGTLIGASGRRKTAFALARVEPPFGR